MRSFSLSTDEITTLQAMNIFSVINAEACEHRYSFNGHEKSTSQVRRTAGVQTATSPAEVPAEEQHSYQYISTRHSGERNSRSETARMDQGGKGETTTKDSRSQRTFSGEESPHCTKRERFCSNESPKSLKYSIQKPKRRNIAHTKHIGGAQPRHTGLTERDTTWSTLNRSRLIQSSEPMGQRLPSLNLLQLSPTETDMPYQGTVASYPSYGHSVGAPPLTRYCDQPLILAPMINFPYRPVPLLLPLEPEIF